MLTRVLDSPETLSRLDLEFSPITRQGDRAGKTVRILQLQLASVNIYTREGRTPASHLQLRRSRSQLNNCLHCLVVISQWLTPAFGHYRARWKAI